MNCPECGGKELFVINTRNVKQKPALRRRRYECQACKRRFSTYEYLADDLPTTLKPTTAPPCKPRNKPRISWRITRLLLKSGLELTAREIAAELSEDLPKVRKALRRLHRRKRIGRYRIGDTEKTPYTYFLEAGNESD